MRKIIPRLVSIAFTLTSLCACDQAQVQEPDVVEPIRYKVSGIVTLEEDGSPLAGIDVKAIKPLHCFLCSDDPTEAVDSVRTDQTGRYSLSWTEGRCETEPYYQPYLWFYKVDRISQNYRTGRREISTPYSALNHDVECTSEPQTIDQVMRPLPTDTTYYCRNSSGGFWRCPPF